MRTFRLTSTAVDPKRLVSRNLQLVRAIARTVAGERNAWPYLEDMVQTGLLTLEMEIQRSSGSERKHSRPSVVNDAGQGRLQKGTESCCLPFSRKRIEGSMLDLLRKERTHDHSEIPLNAPAETTPPGQQIDEQRRRDRFRFAIHLLPQPEKRVVEMLCRENATQEGVGLKLGMNQRRVSRIRDQAIERLRPSLIGYMTA